MKDLKSLRSTLTGPVSLGILSRERSLLMGMAMAWVVFFHMTVWIPGDWPVLSFIKGMGNIGVDMFLILSGAGLYHSYQTLSEQGLGFKEFYRKRFRRIAPAVVICLLPWFTYQQFTAPSSFARYLMDITSLSFWRDGRNPGWYAAFSIVLYALYPLIFASIRPGDARRNISAFLAWGGVFVLFSYIIKWYDPVYYWQIELALSRFPVFFFGCFIAPEIERGREVSGWFLLALYVASGVLIAWMAGSPEGIGGVYEFTRYAYCPVAFGLLMLSARLLSAASGASALRPVRAGLRACLKHHSRHLHAPLCGIFGPNSLNAAHCAAFIWPKSPTKRNAHLAESMFQTCSSFAGQHTLEIYLLHTQILSVCSRFLLPLPGIQGLKRADVWVNLAALLLTLAGAGAVKALERTVLRLKERMEPDAPRENPDAGIAFVRAAAAAMIIACHMLQFYGNALAYWLNVGVEVFLIISGVLYGQRDISAPFGWIRRQWRKVLVPYWVFCLAAVFAYAVFANEYVTLYGCAGLLLACKRFPGLGHLWFIPYILLLYLMTPLLQWTYDEYLSERPDREVAVWLMLLTGVLWLLRYYGMEDFAENRLVCYYGGYVLGRRFFRGKKEGGRNPALEKWMNRAGAAALVTAAARGFIQYHALEEAVPCWSYVLPFIHSLMGFGVFWALYRAAGWSGLGKSRCVRLADRYSFEIYLTHHIFILGAGRLHCMEVFSHPACNVLLVLAFTAASAWLLHFAARAAKRPPERNFKTRSETPERTQEQAHDFIQYLS